LPIAADADAETPAVVLLLLSFPLLQLLQLQLKLLQQFSRMSFQREDGKHLIA